MATRGEKKAGSAAPEEGGMEQPFILALAPSQWYGATDEENRGTSNTISIPPPQDGRGSPLATLSLAN